jgi:hypothetical protein
MQTINAANWYSFLQSTSLPCCLTFVENPSQQSSQIALTNPLRSHNSTPPFALVGHLTQTVHDMFTNENTRIQCASD